MFRLTNCLLGTNNERDFAAHYDHYRRARIYIQIAQRHCDFCVMAVNFNVCLISLFCNKFNLTRDIHNLILLTPQSKLHKSARTILSEGLVSVCVHFNRNCFADKLTIVTKFHLPLFFVSCCLPMGMQIN